ncbi:hypothetical protein Peur_003639 [Populus x canadensis]
MTMLSLLIGSPVTTEVLWASGPSEWAAKDLIAPARGIPREDIYQGKSKLFAHRDTQRWPSRVGCCLAGAEAPLGPTWTATVVMDILENLPSQ